MIQAVIFDLDGVIVSTDEFHYKAWKTIASEEGIYFDRKINNKLRGISREESLEIILGSSNRKYTDEQKKTLLRNKNQIYIKYLDNLLPENILPGVTQCLNILRDQNIKVAIGSSSKNAKLILRKINLLQHFDEIVDGTMISNSKPDPEVFLLASKRLNVIPSNCVVVEDARAGVDAAITAGMKVIAIGEAVADIDVKYKVNNLNNIKSILEELNDD